MECKAQIELLLSLLNAESSGEQQVSNLSVVEWESIAKQATRQGVAPLIYDIVKNKLPKISLPSTVLVTLEDAYYQNSFGNMRLYHQLTEVIHTLHEAGIPVIVLKGTHLAKTIYKTSALRVIGDIDLLVQKNNLARTAALMIEMGYHQKKQTSIESQCSISHHLTAFKKNNAKVIEIHWTIIPDKYHFKVDVDAIFLNARRTNLSNHVAALCLSSEHLLLHLCIHATWANNFSGLRHLYDIALTLDHYGQELDWDKLRYWAQQWRVTKLLYLSLYMIKDLFNAKVPDEYIISHQPNPFSLQVIQGAKNSVFKQRDVIVEPILEAVLISKSMEEKISIFLKRTFPSRQFMEAHYSVKSRSMRIYFMYLVRWYSLLVRHSMVTCRFIFRRNSKEAMDNAAFKNWIRES